jgi:hypothetical protein
MVPQEEWRAALRKLAVVGWLNGRVLEQESAVLMKEKTY